MSKIQLYYMRTPNGQKISVALEELGLEYDLHYINIMKGDQHTDEYKKVNPNSKIPAIVDPNGPGHFFKYAPEKIPYAIERYTKETRRLLGVLEKQLGDNDYIVGSEYSIADISTFTWVLGLEDFYKAREVLKLDEFPKVLAWAERCKSRPAAAKGLALSQPQQ